VNTKLACSTESKVFNVVPQELSGNSKQQDIHIINELLFWKCRPNGSDARREVMVRKVEGISVVEVEMLDDVFFAGPHEDFMLNVPKVRGKTGAEVPSTENENLRAADWLWLGEYHGFSSRMDSAVVKGGGRKTDVERQSTGSLIKRRGRRQAPHARQGYSC